MGEGLSRDLISKGWAVACVDVQEQAGKALVAELGPNAYFIKCDIADYDDQARMYAEVWQKWGRIDALLANAGIVDRSSIYILDHRNSDRYEAFSPFFFFSSEIQNGKMLITQYNKSASRPSQTQHVPMSTTKRSCMACNWLSTSCGRTRRREARS